MNTTSSGDTRNTRDKLAALLQRDFEIAPEKLVPEATLESLEIDSLRMIEILFSIEEEFGISVPGDAGELRARVKTFGDLADFIDSIPAAPGP